MTNFVRHLNEFGRRLVKKTLFSQELLTRIPLFG